MANELVKGARKQVQNKNSQSSYRKKCGCCGISELWYLSMIQCSACQEWFHEGCVKCLSQPLFLGDCFYIFVCSSCNFKVEYVGRLQLTWLELVHLVLFNLMFKYRKSYYDLDCEILPWVKDHWGALQTGTMNDVSDEERRKEFLDALKSNPNRFKCGDEIRKRVSWWALRICCPPTAPTYQLVMSDTVLTNSAVHQLLASEPRLIDRKSERLQPVKKVYLSYPQKDEYYEKWMKARTECKRRKRKTESVSLPKRKAALDCREKCKIMAQSQWFREMPVNNARIQSTGSCISKHNVKQASSRGTSSHVGQDCRSFGPRSRSYYHQTREANVEGVASGSRLLKKQPSSQILKASQKKKRGNKAMVNDDVVVKKRRGRPRLCSSSAETILWTHHLMASVKDTAVELQGRNCTQREFTMLMARRIPFYSRTVDDVREYFKDTSNLAAREGCRVMGKRVSPEGLVQYLVVKNEPVHSLL